MIRANMTSFKFPDMYKIFKQYYMHYGFVPTLMQRQPKNGSYVSDLYKNQNPTNWNNKWNWKIFCVYYTRLGIS